MSPFEILEELIHLLYIELKKEQGLPRKRLEIDVPVCRCVGDGLVCFVA
jgi:hypothetical protein